MTDFKFDPKKYKGHTEGLWTMYDLNCPTDGWLLGVKPEDKLGDICSVHTYKDNSERENSEAKVNALLIADAPLLLARVQDLEDEKAELINVLNMFLDAIDEDNDHKLDAGLIPEVNFNEVRDRLADIREALNKAKGGE